MLQDLFPLQRQNGFILNTARGLSTSIKSNAKSWNDDDDDDNEDDNDKNNDNDSGSDDGGNEDALEEDEEKKNYVTDSLQ